MIINPAFFFRIKLQVLVVCLLLLTRVDSFAQTFTGYYGDSQANSIKQAADGSFIVAGFTDLSTAGGNDMYLMKMDINGNVLWQKTYGGSGDDEATAVQITSDGGFIIAGFTNSFGAGGYDMYLIKTNSLGDTLWSRTYGGGSDDEATSVQQTDDGGYILAGYTYSYGAGGGFSDGYLVKTDANGDTLWTKVFGGTAGDVTLNSVAQCKDKGYITAGYSRTFPAASNPRFIVLKTDSNGIIAGGIAPTFARYFGSSTDDEATSVVQAADGGFVVAGFTNASGGSSMYTNGLDHDMAMVKLTNSGTPAITFQYHYGGQDVLDGSYDDMGYSVQQTSDGGYILGGSSQVNLSGIFWEMFLIKTDANGIGGGNGNLIYPYDGRTSWSESYGIYNNGDDQGYSAIQTNDGGYIIAGENGGGTIYIFKTDTVGNDCDQSDFPLYEQGTLSWTLSTPTVAAFKVNSGGAINKPLTIVGNGPAIDTVFSCRSNVVALPPTADYTASDSAFCVGNCISFVNTSQNATSYQWLFPGATPSSSASAAPSNICYNATGNYDVTLIASNGNGSDTLVISNYINVYTKPTIPISPSAPAFCNGQSTQLIAGGGSTYSWSPSTGLSATTGDTVNANPSSTTIYTVTGTDVNGCSNTSTVTVTVNPLPVINAGSDVVICPNDTAHLNVTGAPAGSTYSWIPTTGLSNPAIANPLATPVVNTTYIVTATDSAGCSGTDSVKVSIGSITAITNTDTTICEGNSVPLLASGGTNYQWTPGTGLSDSTIANPTATPFATITYTVTASTGTCTSTATVTITVLPSPPTPTITLSNDTLFCSYDSSYASYQWFSNSTMIPGGTESFLVISQNGNYNLQVSNVNDCKIAVGINVIVLGVQNNIYNNTALSIYPNPSTGIFEILFTTDKPASTVIELHNMLGEIVYMDKIKAIEGQNKIEVAGQNLSAGIYFVKVINESGNWQVGRFVKE